MLLSLSNLFLSLFFICSFMISIFPYFTIAKCERKQNRFSLKPAHAYNTMITLYHCQYRDKPLKNITPKDLADAVAATVHGMDYDRLKEPYPSAIETQIATKNERE